MDSLIYGRSAVAADVPVRCAVGLPFVGHARVRAIIMVALPEALLVGVAPMLCELVALHADSVVAAHSLGVGLAAALAEAAVIAAVAALVAVAALLADEVVEVVIVGALGAVVMLAMLAAVLALAAVFAQLILLVAVAAVRAEVFVPLTAVRAEAMFAVVVSLAVLAQTTVFALRIVGALLAVGAEVFFVVTRSYAVAVGAISILAVRCAAFFAETTVVASIHSFTFGTFAALFAEPFILFAAVDTVVAAALTIFYLVAVAETEVTLWTVLRIFVTACAKAALIAYFHVARAALITMLGIVIQVQFAKSMLTATRHGRIFTSHFEGVVTLLAVITMTVGTMFFNQRIFTVTGFYIYSICHSAE